MSDKEWYEGLTASELEGKHVHVVYDYGAVVDGELLRDGQVRLDLWASGGAPVFLVDDGCVVGTRVHIRSVSLVWDERDWEQIPIEDAEEGDVLVIGESREDIFEIHGKNSADRWWAINNDEDSCITPGMISCVLRKKSKLPTEPGFYRDGDGTLLIRLKSKKDSWMYASRDFTESGAFIDGEQAAKYLPLTPVHFVDGRAE